MIVSGFTAALDLDTYPLRNLIRPRCAERAKPGRGKPVLIMHIGFLACFHAISLERSRFSKIATLFFLNNTKSNFKSKPCQSILSRPEVSHTQTEVIPSPPRPKFAFYYWRPAGYVCAGAALQYAARAACYARARAREFRLRSIDREGLGTRPATGIYIPDDHDGAK